MINFNNRNFELIQTSLFKDSFELMSGDIATGVIRFPKFFSSNAEITIGTSSYTVKNESFWKGKLGVYQKGYELPVGKYERVSFQEGEIKIGRGGTLKVKSYFFRSVIHLKIGETILIEMKTGHGFKRLYRIEQLRNHKYLDDNPWIIYLLCYIIIMKQKNRRAATA